ncbi:MAG: hypothetical protein AAF414_24255 [Pseudomonadota bacterium]
MSKIFTALFAAIAVLGLSMVSANADEIIPTASLAGTIWVADEPHDRTAIDRFGTIEIKEGKDIYVEFGDLVDGIYTIRVHWWNEEAEINVVEYAVLTQVSDNMFSYTETDHPADSGFPGIIGAGTFQILDENTAQLTQAGRLLDGSASSFQTHLILSDAAPSISIPQTYPPQ